MDHASVCARAKRLVEAGTKSVGEVDDETWADLIEIGKWARLHSLNPSLVALSVPKQLQVRTWLTVMHSAQAVIDAIGCAD